MLPAPNAIATNPIYAPLLALLRDTLLTSEEVAAHWRYSAQYLSNMRRDGRGPAFTKLGTGAIRYRLADIAAHELAGANGYSPARLSLALLTIPGLDHDVRRRIEGHVQRVLAEPEESGG